MAAKQESCFFQVKLSPVPKKAEQIKEEDTVLVLAPFQNVPKIHFEDIKVGTTKTQNVIIRNPGDQPAQVELTKLPPLEEGFTFSATSFTVDGHSHFELQVSWTPVKEKCQRNVVKVINSYNLKLDLVIISKSVCPPKLKKRNGLPLKSCNGSRSSAFVAKKSGIKQISHKSPPVSKPSARSSSFNKYCSPKLKKISSLKKSSVTESFSPVIGNQLPPCIVSTTPRRETYDVCRNEENKENVAAHPLPGPSWCKKEQSYSSNTQNTGSVDRRKTYAIKSTSSAFECSSVKSIKRRRIFRKTILSDSFENVEVNNELLLPRLQTCSTSSINISFDLNLKEDLDTESYSDSLEDVFVSEKTDAKKVVSKWQLQTGRSSAFSSDSSVASSTPFHSDPANEYGAATGLTDKFSKLRCHSPLSQTSSTNGKASTFSPSLVKRLHELDFSDVSFEDDNKAEAETTYDIHNISLSSGDIAHLSSGTFVKSDSSFPELLTQLQDLDEPLTENVKNKFPGNLSAIEESKESTGDHSSCIKETSTVVASNQNVVFQISPPKGSCYSNLSASTSTSKILNKTLPLPSVTFKAMNKTTSWPTVKLNQNTPFRASPPKNNNSDLCGSQRTSKVLKKTTPYSSSSGRHTSHETKSVTKDPDSSAQNPKLPFYGIKKTKLSALSKRREEQSAKKQDPENFLFSLARPSVAAEEPFTTSAVYFDEEWLVQQQEEYTKWLNRLLTPPAELNSNTAPQKVDVAAIYMESCRQEQVQPAPSKETVSSQYHTQHRLVSLRKAAMSLFRSNDIAGVLSKTVVHVDKNLLTIRDDRDLHRDIGLKCMVIELLLCYNPLWLRIGLETIYGENIHLQSNSDILGLTHFIANRLLSDPYIFKQHSHPTVRNLPTPGFAPAMKKFTLKKFLMLVYFLDQAKQNKLIGHDPCLFCKNAKYKESREILISFSRELLSGVGDITKHLKSLGYVVSHKQTYLDEFDYAVRSLGSDLRDGIRLCRVMEIILEKWTLSQKLRVPAISRLQKIHNVDIALSALKDAGYELTGGIEAKDICNGHREKTLSLLWQIIYKFQAPRFQVAATRIQRWWRCLSLKLEIARRIHQRKVALQIQAAVIIQAYWRGYKARQKYFVLKEQAKERHSLLTKASTVIQRNWRKHRSLLNLKRQQVAARKIQAWYRGILAMRIERSKYIRKRNAALKIQAFCRGYLLRQRLKKLRRMAAALRIQTWYRNQKRSREITAILHLYKEYLNVKQQEVKVLEKAALVIQAKLRSTLLMRVHRKMFVEQRRAAVLIQQRFRATLLMRKQRSNYLQQKKAALMIKHYYRAYCLMRKERASFLQQKKAVIVVQQRYRANQLMKKERTTFLQLKKAVIVIQQRYRAIQLMRKERTEFLQLKRAVVVIQQRYRAVQFMRKERTEFLQLKTAAYVIQQRYRAVQVMKKERTKYLQLKKAAYVIQQRYHAIQVMRKERTKYLQLKRAVFVIQQRYRAIRLMRKERTEFLQLKRAVVVIQQRYPAIRLMRKERTEFLQLKRAVVVIQQRYRAIRLMRKERTEFLLLKRAVVVIQQRYRAIRLMRKERTEFLLLKRAVVVIQQRYRAIRLMRKERTEFLQLKRAVVVIQQRYRAIRLMRKERTEFLQLKRAVVVIQQRYRAIRLMRKERTEFLLLKRAVVVIQQRYRAIRLMRKERTEFLQLKRAVVVIQQRYHAIRLMRKERTEFLQLKRAVVVIQQRYRAIQLMRKERTEFLQLKRAVVVIQQRYRAIRLMRKERTEFLQQKEAAIFIQQRYHALLLMKKSRAKFLQHKQAAERIQQWYRGVLQLRKARGNFLKQRMAVVAIQQWFRINKERKRRVQKEHSLEARAATKIQSAWRGYLERRNAKHKIVADLRERALDATRNALPENTLHFRCRSALKTLLSSWLNFQLKAFIELDTVTRLSPELCVMVANHEHALRHIFHFLENSNRSSSVIAACEHATSILLNLVKYKVTMEAVLKVPNSISIILKAMSSSYGKENSLFCKCCTILWLLAQDESMALEIRNTPKIEQCFALWYKKLKPKHEPHSARKNCPKNPASSLPSTEPQWCLGSKHVKWTFTDQFEALITVATALKIKEYSKV